MTTHAYNLPNWMGVPGDKPTSGGDPILRSFDSETRRVYAIGGLHYTKGNAAPYFSLTLASWTKHGVRKSGGYNSPILREDSFGCAHDELITRWPELAPLAALHLSDWHGVPMHAEGNGWYWLAGYGGGLGERYHGGNSEAPHNLPEKCLEVWAEHVRIPIDEARALADGWIEAGREAARAGGYTVADGVTHALKAEAREIRKLHAAWIEGQRPRWQAEADECVKALGLTYYYGVRFVAQDAA